MTVSHRRPAAERSAPTLLDVMGRSPNSAPPAVPMRMAVPGVSAVPKRMAADALMPPAEPGVMRGVLRLLAVEGRSMPAHQVQRTLGYLRWGTCKWPGGVLCRSRNRKAEREFF